MREKLKIAIWMNIPSHYQRAFFEALSTRDCIDLQVRYLEELPAVRKAQGWKEQAFLLCEQCVARISRVEDQLETMPDWRERIHIISCVYSRPLAELLTQHNVRWCHWSERPGVQLARKLRFNMRLFNWLYPIYLQFKKREYHLAATSAVAVFGQGKMAVDAFKGMGINESKIAKLYYTPPALSRTEPNADIVRFANCRRVFLTVCMLNERKGIDLLLRAMASLKNQGWCLVLCGRDLSSGRLADLAEKLKLNNDVLFLGAIPFENLNAVYSAADVDILASRFDGWGAVLNEGASVGLPLIGSDSAGASWELICEGENGFRFAAGNWKKLAAAMKHYVDHPELLKSHGARSREIFEQGFSPECNAETVARTLAGK